MDDASAESAAWCNEQYLLNQGFTFRPRWWTAGMPTEWTSWVDELPAAPKDPNGRFITRGDLLRIASSTDLPEPATLLAAYAWGTGPAAFLVGRRARTLRRNAPDRLVSALRDARRMLEQEGPVQAYAAMARGGPHYLRYLGPSFYTKLLYAWDSGQSRPEPRALILDRFVAQGLNTMAGRQWSTAGPWRPDQYEWWLTWADQQARGAGVRPDVVELAVFRQGRESSRSRSRAS